MEEKYGKFIALRDGDCDEYDAFLMVENSSGQRVQLAYFEKWGDAVTAARLFHYHVEVESIY